MYYHKEKPNSKEYNDIQLLLDNIEKYTWNDLINQMSENSQYFEPSLGDDNDMLNFFIEYTSNHYNSSKAYDPNFMKLFYNETSYTFFDEFYDLVYYLNTFKGGSRREMFTNALDTEYIKFI